MTDISQRVVSNCAVHHQLGFIPIISIFIPITIITIVITIIATITRTTIITATTNNNINNNSIIKLFYSQTMGFAFPILLPIPSGRCWKQVIVWYLVILQ